MGLKAGDVKFDVNSSIQINADSTAIEPLKVIDAKFNISCDANGIYKATTCNAITIPTYCGIRIRIYFANGAVAILDIICEGGNEIPANKSTNTYSHPTDDPIKGYSLSFLKVLIKGETNKERTEIPSSLGYYLPTNRQPYLGGRGNIQYLSYNLTNPNFHSPVTLSRGLNGQNAEGVINILNDRYQACKSSSLSLPPLHNGQYINVRVPEDGKYRIGIRTSYSRSGNNMWWESIQVFLGVWDVYSTLNADSLNGRGDEIFSRTSMDNSWTTGERWLTANEIVTFHAWAQTYNVTEGALWWKKTFNINNGTDAYYYIEKIG